MPIIDDECNYSEAERRFLRELHNETMQGEIARQRKADAESASIETAEELQRLYELLEEERQARISAELDSQKQWEVEKRRFIVNLCVTIISAVAAVIAATVAVITLF